MDISQPFPNIDYDRVRPVALDMSGVLNERRVLTNINRERNLSTSVPELVNAPVLHGWQATCFGLLRSNESPEEIWEVVAPAYDLLHQLFSVRTFAELLGRPSGLMCDVEKYDAKVGRALSKSKKAKLYKLFEDKALEVFEHKTNAYAFLLHCFGGYNVSYRDEEPWRGATMNGARVYQLGSLLERADGQDTPARPYHKPSDRYVGEAAKLLSEHGFDQEPGAGEELRVEQAHYLIAAMRLLSDIRLIVVVQKTVNFDPGKLETLGSTPTDTYKNAHVRYLELQKHDSGLSLELLRDRIFKRVKRRADNRGGRT